MCMIDQDTRDLIDSVVELWVGQGRAFTAYEVSKEVQARLAEKNLPFVRHVDMVDYYRHNECKVLVDQIGSGAYRSTLRSMGSGLEAFVYHPYNYDPMNYTPLPRDNNVGVQPAQVPVSNMVVTGTKAPIPLFGPSPPVAPSGSSISLGKAAAPVSASNAPRDPNVSEVNKSSELWVGVSHVQTAGWKAGDTVSIKLENNTAVITAFDTKSVLKTVEKYGNLRLYQHERSLAGLNGSRFRIESKPGEIVIKEA